MKRLLASLFMMMLGMGLVPDEAQAARLGGGRSLGAQRAVPMQRQAVAPTPQKVAPAPAAAPQPNRWFGPLAGLAAGLGLGWLLSQGGFGGMLGTLLMAFAAVAVVMMLVRVFARPRPKNEQAVQYAGLGNETVAAPPPSQRFGAESHETLAAPPSQLPGTDGDFGAAAQIPAGFDVEGFLAQAKRNFIRLQEANDKGDLQTLRQLATDEMFESLRGELASRATARQQTAVVMLGASLLEVVTESTLHWASVRFSGSLRDDPNAVPAPFDEVWHLQKPVSGETGWLLAGIQQLA